MQAILTKYIGPTNSRPGRVRAWCDAGSVTVSWDAAQGIDDNHRAAWHALLLKLEWHVVGGKWAQGSMPGKRRVADFVFVRTLGAT